MMNASRQKAWYAGLEILWLVRFLPCEPMCVDW